ncbi:VanZ family protein [Arthrobacter sp. Bz4]|uniref:VanZ family protein n=1 Tax=Arthrobacter sp. Bz4 TaxID=2171979 RepID=UPI001402FB6F|nr:VanZ family protein [Arthrobacter sp. Bz4]
MRHPAASRIRFISSSEAPLIPAPLPSRRYRTITGALCAAWLLAVTLIVFNRTPVDAGAGDLLQRGLRFLHAHGIPAFIDYGLVEFTANIVMFVPFGVFWFILAPRNLRWLGPALGVSLSVLIELSQLIFLPLRFATPYDVVANGLGACLGTALAWAALHARERTRQRGEPPARVGLKK